MTTHNTPTDDLVPPRPDLVPTSGTTSPMRPRPSSPTPKGDEVALRRPGTTPDNTHNLVPRDDVADEVNR